MAILGFTIPPHAMADHDHGKEVNRCPNAGCGLLQEPKGGILRCPPNCKMVRATTVKFTQLELEREARHDGHHAPPEPTPERFLKVGR